jgi:hypothetical protein
VVVPGLPEWRRVVPDINAEEVAALRNCGVIDPTDMFTAEEALAVLRFGLELGRTVSTESGQ